MKIDLKTTNFKTTPPVKNYLEERINHLDKFINPDLIKNNSIIAYIELAMTTKHHHKGNIFYAEADVKLPGRGVRAEAEAEDVFSAIDKMKDILGLELKKYKEKKESVFKRGARILKNIFRLV